MQQNCPDNMFRVAPMEVRTTVADFHEAGMTPATKDLLTKAVPTSSGQFAFSLRRMDYRRSGSISEEEFGDGRILNIPHEQKAHFPS